MAIPQALYLLTLAKTRGRKVFLWSAIMLMFVSIYKTGSRGPWIAVFLSLAVLLLLNKDRLRKYVLVIILMTLTVLIVRPGVWQTIWDLYGETMDPDTLQGVSYQWRYALYRIAVKELDKDFGRALWGYGPESFFYLGIEDEFQGHMVTYDSCDSSIAALMIETGYVGLLITALLLLKPAFVAYRSFRKLAKPANSLCLVLLVNMLAFYFLMTNVAIYGWGQQSYMLWILIALAMTYPHLQRDEGAADDSAQTVPQLVEAMAF
jgi:O-antigen ligase